MLRNGVKMPSSQLYREERAGLVNTGNRDRCQDCLLRSEEVGQRNPALNEAHLLLAELHEREQNLKAWVRSDFFLGREVVLTRRE